ncbi:helix-turn-helix domain-containing protein [Pseudomonas cremoricolorata]|uniref:helix-turn-helix domain-containing protein n=1 Tax=Pseudomonas cremoricolorata TaxID=157783 RepID=UPI00048BF48F|nr:helix-turn-helix domain-containing protein [Pseudomonas cremoricolorata]
MNIGERLREERVRLGLNQADFAAIAGVTKTSQFNYEKGERSPDAAYLAALALHGVDILYVVTGERCSPAADMTDEARSLIELLPGIDKSDQTILLRTAKAFARSRE